MLEGATGETAGQSTQVEPFGGRDRLSLAVLGVVPVLALWLPWITSSFWLDETGTAWVTAGTFHEVLTRSKLEGQTPIYYAMVWVVRRIGSGEWLVRLPSLLAGLLAA